MKEFDLYAKRNTIQNSDKRIILNKKQKTKKLATKFQYNLVNIRLGNKATCVIIIINPSTSSAETVFFSGGGPDIGVAKLRHLQQNVNKTCARVAACH